jgi:hypothetical protein
VKTICLPSASFRLSKLTSGLPHVPAPPLSSDSPIRNTASNQKYCTSQTICRAGCVCGLKLVDPIHKPHAALPLQMYYMCHRGTPCAPSTILSYLPTSPNPTPKLVHVRLGRVLHLLPTSICSARALQTLPSAIYQKGTYKQPMFALLLARRTTKKAMCTAGVSPTQERPCSIPMDSAQSLKQYESNS